MSYQEWTTTTLGDLSGQRGKSINPSKTPENQFELYSVPSFPNDHPEIVFGKEVGSNKQIVETQSVLLCKINPRINRVWVVGDFTEHEKIASTEWIVFPYDEKIAPEFLCYYLQQNAVREFLAFNASGVGGSLMRVKPTTIRDYPFAHPGIDEQRRIVAEIEKQFTRLDAGVAALQRVQLKLKRYRASVLKSACEGRLVPTESELAKVEAASRRLSSKTTKSRDGSSTYEPAKVLLQRILTERREKWNGRGKYKEPAAPDIANLPELPEGWVWANMGQCFNVVVGATPSRKEKTYWDGSIPWVSSGEVQFCRITSTKESITEVGLANSSTKLNPKGSILLGMIGEGKTRGQCAILDIAACNNQNCAALWVSETPISPLYVYYWLYSQYEITRKTGSGNNQKALNKALVESLLIPLPPLAEQERIMEEVERRLSVIDELETTITANLQRATRLRQSILQKAFSGCWKGRI